MFHSVPVANNPIAPIKPFERLDLEQGERWFVAQVLHRRGRARSSTCIARATGISHPECDVPFATLVRCATS